MSDNYPPGADNKKAPWNLPEPEPAKCSNCDELCDAEDLDPSGYCDKCLTDDGDDNPDDGGIW